MPAILNILWEQIAVLVEAWPSVLLIVIVVAYAGRLYGRHTMKERVENAESRVKSLQDKLDNTPDPKSKLDRNPNAIFQGDEVVGRGKGINQLSEDTVRLDQIEPTADFDQSRPFQIADYVLLIRSKSSTINVIVGNPTRAAFRDVLCQIVGRQP